MCAAEISVWISGVNFMKALVVFALAKIFPSTFQNDKKQLEQLQDKRRQLRKPNSVSMVSVWGLLGVNFMIAPVP